MTLGFPSANWGKELFEGCDTDHRKQSMSCVQSDRKSSLRDAEEEGKKLQNQEKKSTAAKQTSIENKWQFCPVPKADVI